ncbi:MAG: hypothetical protein BJ554DRAFT_8129 [Olpidium bornovanus]|uniref:Uncharacterized protein n=1 Tax=Olpidium bornovanus TaxID=278681 RepID=A0A8H7ZUT5_9FUNG|nr:MAG: hypothetical protein BJ554DRAFT_8129 [Olpidium bornovanus]
MHKFAVADCLVNAYSHLLQRGPPCHKDPDSMLALQPQVRDTRIEGRCYKRKRDAANTKDKIPRLSMVKIQT